MRNLNPETFEELTEVIVRHLQNQWRPDEIYTKGDHNATPRHSSSITPYRHRLPEPKQLEMVRERDVGPPLPKDVRSTECFRCSKRGHMRRNCRFN